MMGQTDRRGQKGGSNSQDTGKINYSSPHHFTALALNQRFLKCYHFSMLLWQQCLELTGHREREFTAAISYSVNVVSRVLYDGHTRQADHRLPMGEVGFKNCCCLRMPLKKKKKKIRDDMTYHKDITHKKLCW